MVGVSGYRDESREYSEGIFKLRGARNRSAAGLQPKTPEITAEYAEYAEGRLSWLPFGVFSVFRGSLLFARLLCSHP